MITLRLAIEHEADTAMEIIDMAKAHLKDQGIDQWQTGYPDKARGKGLSTDAFRLAEELSKARGIDSFQVDTDADNQKMQHVLKKNGFEYCGTIWFDNSEKIAFDKLII